MESFINLQKIFDNKIIGGNDDSNINEINNIVNNNIKEQENYNKNTLNNYTEEETNNIMNISNTNNTPVNSVMNISNINSTSNTNNTTSNTTSNTPSNTPSNSVMDISNIDSPANTNNTPSNTHSNSVMDISNIDSPVNTNNSPTNTNNSPTNTNNSPVNTNNSPANTNNSPANTNNSNNTNNNVKLSLLPHQEYLTQYMNTNNSRGFVLFHGLGSGKTISSIALSELYPRINKYVVSPASLKNNYVENIDKFFKDKKQNIEDKLKYYHINSYEGFRNEINKGFDVETDKSTGYKKKYIVILDEAHRIRNINKTSKLLINFINPQDKKINTNKASSSLCELSIKNAEGICYPYKIINKNEIIEEGINRKNLVELLDKKNILHNLKITKNELDNIIKFENQKGEEIIDEDCVNGILELNNACNYIRKDAHKIFLLTGTPMMNHPVDVAPLVNLITGKNTLPTDSDEFDNLFIKHKELDYFDDNKTKIILKNKNLFSKKIKGIFSYYKPSLEEQKENYPERIDKTVEVVMDNEQFKRYKDAINNKLSKEQLYHFQSLNDLKLDSESKDKDTQKGGKKPKDKNIKDKNNNSKIMFAINSFLTVSRQISNTYESNPNTPKIKGIVENLINGPKPAVVYSNYIQNGLDALMVALYETNIKFGLFTGSVTEKKKKQLIEEYNNYNNDEYSGDKIDVLLISSSGSEGLNLLNTRQIHIMEPHWNANKIEQVIGRVFRFKSHNSLPENERNITVYKWLSILPNKKESEKYSLSNIHRTKKMDKYISVDQKLDKISLLKRKIILEFEKLIEKHSIESDNIGILEKVDKKIKLLTKTLEELNLIKKQLEKKYIKEKNESKLKNINKNLDKINKDFYDTLDELSRNRILKNSISIREEIL